MLVSYKPYETYYSPSTVLGSFYSYNSPENALEQAVTALEKFKNNTEDWAWPSIRDINIQFLQWNRHYLYGGYESTGIFVVNLDREMSLSELSFPKGVSLKYGAQAIHLPECNGWEWEQIFDYVQPIILNLIEEEIVSLSAQGENND